MSKSWTTALRLFLILAIITGILYPLAITLAGAILMPSQAYGSLVTANGTLVGSMLIGQTPFQVDEDGRITNLEAIQGYFWGRPSAVNAMLGSSADLPGSSGGSNLGPTSATLQAQVTAREAAFRTAHNLPATVTVPPDMLFASGSGLDPHISPQAALLQVERVAQARALPVAELEALVRQHIEPPLLTVLGSPSVNVLALNLALDAMIAGQEQ
jgi:K+-transporting ATPase ATPase C chain